MLGYGDRSIFIEWAQFDTTNRYTSAIEKSLPSKIRSLKEMPFDVSEAAVEASTEECFHGQWNLLIEKRTEAAQLHLRGDEAQHPGGRLLFLMRG
jgi:hypothetical protein